MYQSLRVVLRQNSIARWGKRSRSCLQERDGGTCQITLRPGSLAHHGAKWGAGVKWQGIHIACLPSLHEKQHTQLLRLHAEKRRTKCSWHHGPNLPRRSRFQHLALACWVRTPICSQSCTTNWMRPGVHETAHHGRPHATLQAFMFIHGKVWAV